MGLPVDLIAAVTPNDIVHRSLQTGDFSLRSSIYIYIYIFNVTTDDWSAMKQFVYLNVCIKCINLCC